MFIHSSIHSYTMTIFNTIKNNMNRKAKAVFLVRATIWRQRCVTYTGCPWSSASFSNCVRWCTSLILDIVHNIYENFSRRHPTLRLGLDSALQTAAATKFQQLVWSSVNVVSRLLVRQRGILYQHLYRTSVTIKLLNEILKLNFLIEHTRHKTVLFVMRYWSRTV